MADPSFSALGKRGLRCHSGFVDPIVWCLVLGGAFGAMMWQRARVQRLLGPAQLVLDEDGEIVMHLARHAARSRERTLGPLYILYGLLQNDDITAAIRRAGGDVDAIEDRVFRELDNDSEGDLQSRWVDTHNVLAWAAYMAGRAPRAPGPADLWGGVVQMAPQTASAVDAGGVSAAEVLSLLVHGDAVGSLPERGNVSVVLVNDDITPQQLVVDILENVFELSSEDAMTRMMQAHTDGRGTVAKYPAAIAKDKVRDAHQLARKHGSPLLFRLEPAGSLA